MNNSIFDKTQLVRYLLLALALLAVTASFIFAWYFDPSKPIGGIGWSDQTMYTNTVRRLAQGKLPLGGQLHFAVGYPLLGAVGYIVSGTDPFMIVSLVLLLGSTVFCFFGAERIFGSIWAAVFCLLLFYWDFTARTFNFSLELFALPWNNQVFFFALSFYFWLFTSRLDKMPSWWLLTATAVVSGFCVLTREETLLFMAPMLAIYLYLTGSDWRRWLFSFSLMGICYLPQALIKLVVLGAVTDTGRGSGSYLQKLISYISFERLQTHIWGTIVNSRHYLGTTLLPSPPRRQALLQAAPWLWAAPVGIIGMLFTKRVSAGTKIFLIISCVVILFYLSGVNMGADRLKYHCLRYIAPGFIALNLAVVFVAHQAFAKMGVVVGRRLAIIMIVGAFLLVSVQEIRHYIGHPETQTQQTADYVQRYSGVFTGRKLYFLLPTGVSGGTPYGVEKGVLQLRLPKTTVVQIRSVDELPQSGVWYAIVPQRSNTNPELPPKSKLVAEGSHGELLITSADNNEVTFNALFTADELKTLVGTRTSDRHAIRSSGESGFLIYGPYIFLPRGTYKVTWYGDASRGVKGRKCGYVGVSANNGGRMVGRLPLCSDQSPDAHGVLKTLTFTLARPARRVEFRMYVNNRADVVVDKIRLKVVKGLPQARDE